MILIKKPSIWNCNINLLYCLFIFTHCVHAAGHESEEEHHVDLNSGGFWGQIIAIVFLVALSGIVAGLTLGLMSLDVTNLLILKTAGTPKQQYYASRILPIRKNGHILLTTLLLTNTVLNETLPILFDDILSKGFLSVIASTILLVLFSEIIPQAIFSKHGLAIGAMFALPVRFLIAIWYIVSWPIAKFLDLTLGTHSGFVYGVAEMRALIGLHDMSTSSHGTLNPRTSNILQNVLDMQDKDAVELITSVHNMLLLGSDSFLTLSKLSQYQSNGYTFIFVYDNVNVIMDNDKQEDTSLYGNQEILGVLDMKSLEHLDDEYFAKRSLGEMNLQSCLTGSSSLSMVELADQLLDKNIKEQVMLIYRTEQDVKAIKDKVLTKLHEIEINRQKTFDKHSKGLQCRISRLFLKQCTVCQTILSSAPVTKDEEHMGATMDTLTTASTPSTINVELQSGLLGMVSVADIFHHLMHATDCKETAVDDKKKKAVI